jgi:hypothetical protein
MLATFIDWPEAANDDDNGGVVGFLLSQVSTLNAAEEPATLCEQVQVKLHPILRLV